MGKWMDLAAQLEAASDAGDRGSIRGANVPARPQPSAALPPDIQAGLDRLQTMAAPRLVTPERWPAATADCMRLATEGWAAKALALGWTPLELFGAVTAADGDPFGDGLAVSLGGHAVLAISETFAVIEDPRGRSYFNRGWSTGAKLIWDIGRGQR